MKQTENTGLIRKESPELRPDGWERFEKAVDAATSANKPRTSQGQRKNRPTKP